MYSYFLQDSDCISRRYFPRSGGSGSYYSSIFQVFFRKLHTVFYNSCNLHSHQQCTRVPFYPKPHLHCLSLLFLILAIPTGIRWYLIVISICISLVTSDAEHLLMYLLAICLTFLLKCQFMPFAHFFNWIVFVSLGCISPLYIWDINPWSCMWFANTVSPSVNSFVTLFLVFFAVQKLFSLF